MLVFEVILIAALLGGYELGRHFASGQLAEATRNALRVWDVERHAGLPNEATIQHWVLHWRTAARLADLYYVGVHFPLTLATLIWLWVWHRAQYLRFRTEMAILTAASLVLHIWYPLAPPRFIPAFGMVDTMVTVGPSAYPDNDGDSGFANQHASMPSLHIGWSILVAVVIIRSAGTRWRYLAILHPVLTTFTVVVTANHYWLDGIVASGLVAAAIFVVAGLLHARVILGRAVPAVLDQG